MGALAGMAENNIWADACLSSNLATGSIPAQGCSDCPTWYKVFGVKEARFLDQLHKVISNDLAEELFAPHFLYRSLPEGQAAPCVTAATDGAGVEHASNVQEAVLLDRISATAPRPLNHPAFYKNALIMQKWLGSEAPAMLEQCSPYL